jgi:anti-sigma factor RsiW
MAAPKRVLKSNLNDSCKRMTDLIFSYLTDRLNPTLKRQFEKHLRICPNCVNFLNTYKKTVSLAGSLSEDEVPHDVRNNVLAFLRRKMHGIPVFFLSLIAQVTSSASSLTAHCQSMEPFTGSKCREKGGSRR